MNHWLTSMAALVAMLLLAPATGLAGSHDDGHDEIEAPSEYVESIEDGEGAASGGVMYESDSAAAEAEAAADEE
jgi:hypothetical protein